MFSTSIYNIESNCRESVLPKKYTSDYSIVFAIVKDFFKNQSITIHKGKYQISIAKQ